MTGTVPVGARAVPQQYAAVPAAGDFKVTIYSKQPGRHEGVQRAGQLIVLHSKHLEHQKGLKAVY
jgi:hypothetical protein